MNTKISSARQVIRTPRAAAVAGILFAVLFTISITVILIAVPGEVNASNEAEWIRSNSTTLSLALTLVPFAGIAFLWFLGVVRDRLGEQEDQFFATVFFGSGLLFLAMIFTSAAIAGGILSSYAAAGDQLTQSGVLAFGRAVMYTIMNVYAIRMASVFMIALGTIWYRTRVMPRLFGFLTFGLAVVMLVSVNLTPWLIMAFPTWVFIVSVYILVTSLRRSQVAT